MLKRYWPEFGAALLALLALFPFLQITIGPDVSWQLWIGRHLNAGVPLYDWIMETNPPLWFWMAQPISAIAIWLDVSPNAVLLGSVWCVMALSLGLGAAVLADKPARVRAGLLASQLVAMAILAFSEVGQRDHLALIGILPYALMMARRAEGGSVSFWLAVAIGLFAAPMIALKHYFVLLPIGLEAWLWWKTRQLRPLRPETLALAAVAIAYAIAIALLTPSYFSDMVPMLRAAYGDFGGPPVLVVFNRMSAAALTVAFYFWVFRKKLPMETQALLVVATGFVATFFLQFKGFTYHQDPAVAVLVMPLLSHVVLALPDVRQAARSATLLLAVCLAILIVPAVMSGPYRNPSAAAIEPFFAGLPGDATIAVITTDPALIWPMVTGHDIRLAQRYYHGWMLHALVKRRSADGIVDGEVAAVFDRYRRETAEDMLCYTADFVLFDNRGPEGEVGFIQSLFASDSEFASLLTSYRRVERVGAFDVLERVSALPPADGLDCMPIGIGLEAPVVALDDDVKHDEAVAAVF